MMMMRRKELPSEKMKHILRLLNNSVRSMNELVFFARLFALSLDLIEYIDKWKAKTTIVNV